MTIENFGLVSASTLYTYITAPTVNNTKGAYTELKAATDNSFEGIVIHTAYCTAPRNYLIDIAIGAAGSEKVIIPNLSLATAGTYEYRMTQTHFFPIRVPKGSRISARYQANAYASTDLGLNGYGIIARGLDGHFALADNVVDMGTQLSYSGGVTLPGIDSSAGWGAWAEIYSATPRQFHALVPAFDQKLDNTRSDGITTIQVGIGPAGSEQAIGQTLRWIHSATDSMIETSGPIIYANIPQGTRIAARAYYSNTGLSADKNIGALIYGI